MDPESFSCPGLWSPLRTLCCESNFTAHVDAAIAHNTMIAATGRVALSAEAGQRSKHVFSMLVCVCGDSALRLPLTDAEGLHEQAEKVTATTGFSASG